MLTPAINLTQIPHKFTQSVVVYLCKYILPIFSIILLTGWIQTAQAAQLPNFKATFDVTALGIVLGQAKQKMHCQNSECTLTSQAKPSGFAAAFFKDSSLETVKLHQDQNQFIWKSYHKVGTHFKNDHPVQKSIHLKLNAQQNKVICPEKAREWPLQPKLFDVVSIAYAIQHAKLNQLPLNHFTLQDSNFQDKLTLKSVHKDEYISLDFAEDYVDAVKYRFTSQHSEIELWLLPNFNYFPGKIRIVNKDEKTISLSLSEPPETL